MQQDIMPSLGGCVLAGLCVFLLGCADQRPIQTVFGPPRFESLATQQFPRLVRFQENPEAKLRAGLWLGLEGTGDRAMGIVLPLPGDPDALPSPDQWAAYGLAARNAAAKGTAPSGAIKIPLQQILREGLLHAPVKPGRIFGAALNHAEHMKDLGFSDTDISDFAADPPRFFLKNVSPLGPYGAIRVPQKKVQSSFRTDKPFIDHEVEIGLVIGRVLRHGDVQEDSPLQGLLAGILLADDVSDREPQVWAMSNPSGPDADSAHWPRTGKRRPWNRRAFDLFTEGKSHATFAVLGPFLIAPDRYSAVYPSRLELWTRRTGQAPDFARRQDGLVCDYLASPQRLIAAALQDPYLNLKELQPGDIILMGTPSGTILKSSLLAQLLPKDMLYPLFEKTAGSKFLKPGDEIWAESDALGFQWNIIKDSHEK